MTSLSDYFAKHRPQPVWQMGDRVFGRWNDIPFIGTVGNDNMVSEQEGPRVSIFLDLPIKFEDKIYSIIFVKQKQIKRLKSLEDTTPLKPKEVNPISAKRTKQNDKEKTSKKV